jgi:glycosyltransferase involved in cell wall biosynthesis
VQIGVDARSLTAARGIARYTSELIPALAGAYADDRWVLFVPGRGRVAGLEEIARLPNVVVRRHPLPSRAVFGAAALTGRPRLDRLLGGALDVLWMPAPAPAALSREVPLVLTVHDLSFERRPADFTRYERLWHRLARPRSLGRRGVRVIVDAEATRTEVVSSWGIAPDVICVVELGVRLPEPVPDAAAIESTLRRSGLRRGGYLLAVGALEPRKGCEQLVRAFTAARSRGLTLELAFAGAGRLAERLVAPGVRLLGPVSDEELDRLYRGAHAVVAASLLEGYGLPVREALARGVPVVASDLPVLDSSLSPALVRFPPGDAAALTGALLRIAEDLDLRTSLAERAPATVAGLSWRNAARATYTVLREAADRG